MGKVLIIKNSDFSVNAIEQVGPAPPHIEPVVVNYSPSYNNVWQYIGNSSGDPCAYMIEVKPGDIVSVIANGTQYSGCTILCKNDPSSITAGTPVVLANGETGRRIYTANETVTFNIIENCYFYVLLHHEAQIWVPYKLTINGIDVELTPTPTDINITSLQI